MKTRTKALLLTLCVVILTVATAYGTYAYFTSSDSATNTFTVGSVGITLDEAKVDTDGTVVGTTRVQANEYHLIPGYSYTKDPTVHVAETSEDAWLFVEVNNGIADIEAATAKGTITEQIVKNGWTKLTGVNGVDNVYYREYKKADGKLDFVVFEEFKVDGDKTVNVPADETVPAGKYDITAYEEKPVTITAYAIQAAGFDDAVSAWTALQAQLNPNP